MIRILSFCHGLTFTTNLTYCVNFNKMTIVCNKTLPPVCGLTETQYTLHIPTTIGMTIFFTVTPVDGGNQMKGTAIVNQLLDHLHQLEVTSVHVYLY